MRYLNERRQFCSGYDNSPRFRLKGDGGRMFHKWLFLGLSLMLVSGCSSTKVAMMTGDYGEIKKNAKGRASPFSAENTFDHWEMCSAMLNMQEFGVFDSCLRELENRLSSQPIELTGWATMNRASSIVAINNLKAEEQLALGKYDQALKYGLVALGSLDSVAPEPGVTHFMGESGPNIAQEIQVPTYGILVEAYALTGNRSKAREYLTKQEAVYTSLKAKSGGFLSTPLRQEKLAESWLARSYVSMNEYEKLYDTFAEQGFSAWDKLHSALLGGLLERMTWEKELLLNRAAFETGRIEIAKKGYDKFLGYKNLPNYADLYFRALQDRSRLAVREGDLSHAEQLISRAIVVLETARKSIHTESSKIGFAGGRYSIYDDMVKLLMSESRYDEAFAYAERGKARALVDMLASKQQFGAGSEGAGEQNKLLAQLDRAEMKSRRGSSGKGKASGTRGIAIKVRTELRQQAPELSSLVTVNAPDVKEIQGLLPQGETLIEYYGSGADLYGFVVTADGIRGVKLDGKGLADEVSAFRQAILQVKSEAYQQSGHALYGRLIAPLASGIHTKNLTIVPHGALHYLPFSALVSNKGFLIERYDIRILPSASVMKFLKHHENKAGSLLALGDPDLGNAKYDLPFAEKEAIRVSKDVAGSKLLLRGQATETAVKEYGSSFRYLHFASHGRFDADKPLQSGLYLAKDGENDGVLTVGELYDLHLNADLVTLSACETGLGKIANGDDVVGLTRGFLYAGTSSIVASLWQVDDAATSDLMSTFYADLGKEDKRSALRDAQLAAKTKYHHPYYWAAFQITGAVN